MLERRNNTSAYRPEEEEEEDGGGTRSSTEGCEDTIYIFNALSPIKGEATL